MSWLVLNAYWKLIYFDGCLARRNFTVLYEKVRDYPTAKRAATQTTERICRAVDLACILYWKDVRCLQRSAATTCLLRGHGVVAHMMIGAQKMPFRSHAWVEVNGRVVNDKPYLREMYMVLDCC
jgi:Transglutaminase-like superfamily